MSSLTFQDVILKLQDYWKDLGCIVRYPYNVQVGAGTMNPATILYVLGPEPWNVVYVEPSIRPDDGRFGDNPNRMQMHHQLQVILKPDPGNPQELYLKSLEAIGIDPRRHDIRFVEDNWESPALGAWGLGWEVWLDGQEITQFTYFQQAGSLDLDPVSVEITYGLDRIVLALQGRRSVWDVDYSPEISYKDVFLRSEIEHCEYYFNVADVDALHQIYDTYEREAQRCVEANLVVPAHDYNLKCSHLFNVLDTRGAIGVTERANYFRRMRRMAQRIAELYQEQRMHMEYPLLEANALQQTQPADAVGHEAEVAAPDAPAPFVLEIGVEELPASDLQGAIDQLRTIVPALLADERLEHGAITVAGTPRRLSVTVEALAPLQTTIEEEVTGPPADRAFDKDGNPTRAAQGFARSRGIDVADLRIKEDGKRRYVVATVREEGRPTADVLAERLPDVVQQLRFDKSMRWNGTNIAFSRPLRWLVALFGRKVIPFSYAGVAAGRVTRGLRPYGSPALLVEDAAGYADVLRSNGILVDMAARREAIRTRSAELAAELNGAIPDDAGLLEEVTNLVESPLPFRGRFEERFLDLPPEILVAVMRKHQRYFPVYDANGRLLPAFIAVRNGDAQHVDIVRDGNEQVIRARFADAEFFYGKDKTRSLASFRDDLALRTFQHDLGSMLDKSVRLERLVPELGALIGASADEIAVATRAAHLAKADLATSMVTEMTSLQGIMGGYYARMSGEPEAVAEAIETQYEAVSQSRPGLLLALADRIDSLVGLTAAGLLPKGSNDPFALRRAAIQTVENLVANTVSIDLRAAFAAAGALMPVATTAAHIDEALSFLAGRLEVLLRDQGYKATVVRAVLNVAAHDPYRAVATVETLQALEARDDWQTVLDAYARCVRITRKYETQFPLDGAALAEAPAQQLLAAYAQAAAAADGTLGTLFATLQALEPSITYFFDNTLVMAEDETVRHNRLALVQRIAALADGIVDLSEMEGF